MKKDIDFPKVKGVSVAIVKREGAESEAEWMVYLLNLNEFAIENVLVCSKGYGELDGEKRQSSTLRHGIPLVEPKATALIEPISPEVFRLTNEYWVSYYIGNQIFDKKFVFVPDTIIDDNLTKVPILGEKGVLHG
jgi:hypothetical protein